MKITLFEIIKISSRYLYICKKGGYFNRRNNFSKIYDHFFIKLYKRLEKSNLLDIEKILNFNIEKCSNDNFEVIEITKPNYHFSKRKVIIPNFYDILFYEVLVQKIIFEINYIFIHNSNISGFLINGKYIGYAHRVNYKTNELNYEYYLPGWNEFIIQKNDLFLKSKFYLETDIKGFYDNISHDNLIYLIKKIIEGNNVKIDIKKINDILLNLNNILFKTSGFKKKGIPQGLILSDILSQLYLWLILYFESLKPEKTVTFKEGIFRLENGSVKIINYSDDIVLFSDKEKNLFKGFSHLNSILEKNGLELNYNKTTLIKKAIENNNLTDINISLVKENDVNEIEKMLDLLLEILKKDFIDINIGNFKKLFKFFYKINLLNIEKKKKYVKEIFKAIKFNSGSIESNKKISLLIIISPDNFVNFINIYFNINHNIEEIFINKYLKDYKLYLSDIHLIFMYSYLGENFIKLRKFIHKIIIGIDNSILKNIVFEKEKKYLKNNLYSNKFYGLYNLLYGDGEKLEENNIGIKLDNLFNIDTSFTDNLFKSYIFLIFITGKEEIAIATLEKLDSILDNLLLIKNINNYFYLENSSFIADLHSLINILLTILNSLEKNKYEIVKISQIKGRLNDRNNNLIKNLKITQKIVNRYDDFLVYITQNRAKLNHKEFDVEVTKNLKVESFTNYDILELNIKSFLNDVLKEINEIYNQKDV